MAQNMTYGCHTCIVPSYCLKLLILGTELKILTSSTNLLVHNVSYGLQQGVGDCAPRVCMPRSPL